MWIYVVLIIVVIIVRKWYSIASGEDYERQQYKQKIAEERETLKLLRKALNDKEKNGKRAVKKEKLPILALVLFLVVMLL